MKIFLIIGAGQLGSRHLQGLLKLKGSLSIYVLDPSLESLEISKKRAKEIENNHKIQFIESWDIVPEKIDFVIISTGANVRAKIVHLLLNTYKVGNLILEKILFQDIESYEKISKLIKNTKTPTWVNHPRRMMSHYKQIKKEIRIANENVLFHVVGGNWGLACNSLHFIDLCYFLTDEVVEEIDFDWVDKRIHKSKRENNIEFTGSVKGKMKNNNCFTITSFHKETSDISINISSASQRWIVQEGKAQKITYLSKENNFNEVVTTFTTDFQSNLTTKIVNDIFEFGKCDLPTYEEASISHIPFIKCSLKKYIEITGVKTNICPIT